MEVSYKKQALVSGFFRIFDFYNIELKNKNVNSLRIYKIPAEFRKQESMMIKVKTAGVTAILVFCTMTVQAEKKSDKFSDYQGVMNWDDAKKKCASLGQRLASIEELQSAYESRLLESWTEKNQNVYWSSSADGGQNAKFIRADYGNAASDSRNARYNVRCLNEGSGRKTAAPKITPLGKFSDYLGAMSWDDAKKKCAEKGMRLPSIEDLRSAYEAKITEAWKADANTYWSSTYNTEGNADTLDIYNNDYSNMRIGYSAHTRCIR